MTNTDSIDPNELADTYEAFSDLDSLVSRIAEARKQLTGEANPSLQRFIDSIKERRDAFGSATANRNPFTMDEYRESCPNRFATIETVGLTTEEHQLLQGLGIIQEDETFHIPVHPESGQRLPLLPYDIDDDVLSAVLDDFTVPSPSLTLFHISDTHLGYHNRSKPEGMGKTKWVDRTDSVAAFQSVLQQAIDEDIDSVLHTGDLFDNDVDPDTLTAARKAIKNLTDEGIPFYFILGDHDRQATGGDERWQSDAICALESLLNAGQIIHCTAAGNRLGSSGVTVFGVDAADVGFEEILNDYTLSDWSPTEIELDSRGASNVNILCLHEPAADVSFSALVANLRDQSVSIDLILLGHEHKPKFDGEWQKEVDGVTIAYAGPTVPISSHFTTTPTGYNRIRIGGEGHYSVDRRTL